MFVLIILRTKNFVNFRAGNVSDMSKSDILHKIDDGPNSFASFDNSIEGEVK